MTISRTIATALFCCLLFPMLSGQLPDPPPDTLGQKVEWIGKFRGLSASDTTDSDLRVPNVFSPNGDQINDFFSVETDGTTLYEFSVFTRTGTRIYYSLSPQIRWDGKSIGGKELREGVYYYVIEKQGSGDPIEKAGYLHLYR